MPLALALREVRLSAVQEQAASYTKKTTRSKLYFLNSLGVSPFQKENQEGPLSLSLSLSLKDQGPLSFRNTLEIKCMVPRLYALPLEKYTRNKYHGTEETTPYVRK